MCPQDESRRGEGDVGDTGYTLRKLSEKNLLHADGLDLHPLTDQKGRYPRMYRRYSRSKLPKDGRW